MFLHLEVKDESGDQACADSSRLSAIVDEYLSHSYGEYLFPQANKINRAGVQETRIGSITGHTEQKAKPKHSAPIHRGKHGRISGVC